MAHKKKVKEIPSKIKVVESVKNSDLEDEVARDELNDFIETVSGRVSQGQMAGGLSAGELRRQRAQEVESAPAPSAATGTGGANQVGGYEVREAAYSGGGGSSGRSSYDASIGGRNENLKISQVGSPQTRIQDSGMIRPGHELGQSQNIGESRELGREEKKKERDYWV